MSTGWRKRGGGMNKQSDSVEQRSASEQLSAQHVGEPVAYVETKEVHGQMCSFINRIDLTKLLPDGAKLYTTPQPVTESHKRKPLTDEQILELNFDGEFCTLCDDDEAILNFARAIEAAHGIRPSDFKE